MVSGCKSASYCLNEEAKEENAIREEIEIREFIDRCFAGPQCDSGRVLISPVELIL